MLCRPSGHLSALVVFEGFGLMSTKNEEEIQNSLYCTEYIVIAKIHTAATRWTFPDTVTKNTASQCFITPTRPLKLCFALINNVWPKSCIALSLYDDFNVASLSPMNSAIEIKCFIIMNKSMKYMWHQFVNWLMFSAGLHFFQPCNYYNTNCAKIPT